MITQNKIEVALAAADQPIMIETAAQLRSTMKEWLNCDVIGIDTEFVRERTWRANLGLVQLSDGQKVWLVDPLKTGPIQILGDLFENQAIVKVLHAPSEDLDVLVHTTDSAPDPMFDTQTACAMLGEPLQMGYHNTVEWLLDITIDKGETRSNWIKRPLRPAQLHYAALDVCLLPMMHRHLETKLVELDRLEWLEEDCTRLLTKALTPTEPDFCWRRINGYGRLDGTSLAILKSLAKWRDEEAEKRNLARGFVIKDTALMTIANQKPRSLEALSELGVWHPNPIQRQGPMIIETIDRSLQEGIKADLPDHLQPKHRPIMHDMRKLVNKKATALSIDPALLASKRELESLILSPENESLPERFTGWRYAVITRELVALKGQYA
jgi:ribonuclease D